MNGVRSGYMLQRALACLHSITGTSCGAGAVIAMSFVAMGIKRCCGREIRTTGQQDCSKNMSGGNMVL
jgi:hypothetical protein